MTTVSAHAQQVITLDSAVARAMRFSPMVHAAVSEELEQEAHRRGSFSIPDPVLFVTSPDGGEFKLGIEQTLDNPLIYIQQSKLGGAQVQLAEYRTHLARAEVVQQVRVAYTQWQFAVANYELIESQDSVLRSLSDIAARRFAVGDAGLLEKTSALARSEEARAALAAAAAEVRRAGTELLALIGASEDDLSPFPLEKLYAAPAEPLTANLWTDISAQQMVVAERNLALQKAGWMPGFSFGYLNEGDAATPFSNRLQVGLTVPLWFWTHGSEVKAARASETKAHHEYELAELQYRIAFQNALSGYGSAASRLQYYETTGSELAGVLLDAASRSYAAGLIGYVEYLAALTQVYDIRTGHLEAIRDYNLSVIELEYLQAQ